jgi:outer membrane protein assembly factor BamB
MKNRSITLLLFVAVLIALSVLTSCSDKYNWPGFRGPDANMLSKSTNLPEEWGKDKNIAWVTNLEGNGWSSPIVWGDKIFVTSTFPEKVNPVPERGPMNGPPPGGGQSPQQGQNQPQPGQNPLPGQNPPAGSNPPQGQATPPPFKPDSSFMKEIYRWEVTCYDLKSGREVWKQVAYRGAPRGSKNPLNTYASETPVTDGKRVFAYFGMTGLFCYDMGGKLLWQKDLGAYLTQKDWGTGSSPVLYNDVLYIQSDNEVNSFIVAIDAETGNEKWRISRDEKTTYSTPYIWKNKFRTELVANGKTARSYDPENGKLLWELKAGGEQVIPSPVGDAELLFLGNAGGRAMKAELIAVKAGLDGEISGTGVAWKSTEASLGNPSPLLYKGLLYIIGSKGEITVLDAATGTLKYTKRINGIAACWSSPWAYNDRIYFFDEKGITRVFNAGDQYSMVGENRLDDKIWGSVAITGNGYIFKGVEKLFCVKK